MNEKSDPVVGTLPTGAHSLPWSTLAKFAAAASAVGGVLLHLIGATVNQAYFQQWGLDPAMFPKATDLTLILGYHALLGSLAEFVVLFFQDYWYWLLGYGVILWLYVWAAEVVTSRGLLEPVRSTLARKEKLVRVLTVLVVCVALTAVAVPFAISAALLAVAGPLSVGDTYGRKLVKDQLDDYKLGCSNLASRTRCVTVTRSGDLIGQGYLIGATEAHVALYSAATNRTMVVERAGLQIVGAPRLTAYPKNWPTAEIK